MAYLRWRNLLLNLGSRLPCVFPLVRCFREDLQAAWAVALRHLGAPTGAVPLRFCAQGSAGARVEAPAMQNFAAAGRERAGPAGARGAGRSWWRWEAGGG